MQHFSPSGVTDPTLIRGLMAADDVAGFLAKVDSRRFLYRARVEREKARGTDNPYERMVHLKAAQLHRNLAFSVAGKQRATSCVEVIYPSAIEKQMEAYQGDDGPRVRVTAVIFGGTLGLLGLIGATSQILLMIAS
ncbi:hypothetical protein G7077_12260 [Sphingomonas piscis]|uniref:Uncharacterized protein n=1 Tax=Sphingomonas piscis TaxID=2714943 RepID=A0A6G7YS45_9SPHN|nr:hypothetical protein [Sphingomonas piscis]QIK79565.1 hypothetical protein G7077_12260 [Sphingomonas piscis]